MKIGTLKEKKRWEMEMERVGDMAAVVTVKKREGNACWRRQHQRRRDDDGRAGKFFLIGFNNLSGILPYSWGNEKNGVKSVVKSLTFDHNFFSGTLPVSLSKLTVSLSKLTELQEISFSHNQFIGTVPT
ncbi:hypothetical protein L2E82_21104 [Cichorium intybus]|uniref:Uncharacterized protein n=1 Tax=Cichorium intybus TaxID=13427 RepID=A0ACB9DV98_CICIN|nr:hypothetical protein L2E82_21104 [Cichorium intybus]